MPDRPNLDVVELRFNGGPDGKRRQKGWQGRLVVRKSSNKSGREEATGRVVAQSAASNELGARGAHEIEGCSVVTGRSKRQALHARGEAFNDGDGDRASVTERRTRRCPVEGISVEEDDEAHGDGNGEEEEEEEAQCHSGRSN